MKQSALPLSYGPHFFGGTTGTRTRIHHLKDVVPSAFVTNLSKSAGDKIGESYQPELNQEVAGFEPAFGTMYSHQHSPANPFLHPYKSVASITPIQ